jgi:hypothetical protein
MFLRSTRRLMDGKEYRYWSAVESKRCAGGRIVQRQVLYLGEINDNQREAWCRVMEGVDEEAGQLRQLALFPSDRDLPDHATGHGIQIHLGQM